MRELSLHILDLVENSIRAQATRVVVRVEADAARDLLRIVVEDDGTGLAVAPDDAADPFFTTKRGKRTGLGLSLFRAAAEQAGGRMTIGRAAAGGVIVTAEMRLAHVDRNPVGDLAGTFAALVLTAPEIDFRFQLRLGDRASDIHVADLAEADAPSALALAGRVAERVQRELAGTEAAAGLGL